MTESQSVGPPSASPPESPSSSVALDPRVEKSFDFLQDATKQLITLATAILTFTITFLKDIATEAGADARQAITGSWIALVLSAIAGLLVLFNMTGVLGRSDLTPNVYKGSIRLFSLVQLISFGVALVLALRFGWIWT